MAQWRNVTEMEFIKIIVLAAVQGITEFFPVSSSGHLVLLQNIFNLDSPGITLEVMLHTGTLLAVLVVFRKDIVKLVLGFFHSLGLISGKNGYEKLAWLVIAANVPAGIVGVLFKDSITPFFESVRWVPVFLIITGLWLFAGKFFKREDIGIKNLSFGQSVIIGISQMVAILPGISRSGATITTGMFLKMKREDAAKFSFLIMLPAVAGATLMELPGLGGLSGNFQFMIVGMLTSFFVGYLSLRVLLKMITACKFHYFAYYCVIVGVAGLILAG